MQNFTTLNRVISCQCALSYPQDGKQGTESKQFPGFSVNYMVIMSVDELSEHRTTNKNCDCSDQNEIQLQ